MGCTHDFNEQQINDLMKSEFNFRSISYEAPAEINVYIDVSSSIKYFLHRYTVDSSINYEKYFKAIYSKKLNSKFNLYGFGTSLKVIGTNDSALINFTLIDNYTDSSTDLELPFQKILADTSSNTLNLIITDGLQDDNYGMGRKNFIIGEKIKEIVVKGRLFGLIAQKLPYYSDTNKEVLNCPLYTFIIGSHKHYKYLQNNFASFSNDEFFITPELKEDYRLTINSSSKQIDIQNKIKQDNLLYFSTSEDKKPNFIVQCQWLNNFIPISSKQHWNVYNSQISENDDVLSKSEWILDNSKIVSDTINKYNNMDSKRIEVKLGNNNSITRILLSKDLPEWIDEKFSTEKKDIAERTYNFSEYFISLKNYLNQNPYPYISYYIIN